jgi:hypothetical protein
MYFKLCKLCKFEIWVYYCHAMLVRIPFSLFAKPAPPPPNFVFHREICYWVAEICDADPGVE